MIIFSLAVIIGAATAFATARRMFAVIIVHGNSMAPTYRDGDRLLVRRRLDKRWQVGDVAVFPTPARDRRLRPTDEDPAYLVKRIVATPGDIVPADIRMVVGGVDIVPEGCLVVRGDAMRSADSRVFGFITHDSIYGVVARQLDSPDRPESRWRR